MGQTVLSPRMASLRKARGEEEKEAARWLRGATVATRLAQQWPREVTSWPALRNHRQERTCAGVRQPGAGSDFLEQDPQ